MVLLVEGAYGRAVSLKDWQAGKDFRIHAGPYFSIRDVDKLKEEGYTRIDFFGKDGFVEFTVEL